MKETLEEFERRSYVIASHYGEPYVFVWKSEKHKKDLKSRIKPEKWDLETFRRFVAWLSTTS